MCVIWRWGVFVLQFTIAILNGVSTAVFFLIIKISCLKSHLIPSMYMQNLKSMYISKLKNYKAKWVSFWQEKCSQSELSILKSKPCHCWVGEAKGLDQGHKPITGPGQPAAGPGDASAQSRVRTTEDILWTPAPTGVASPPVLLVVPFSEEVGSFSLPNCPTAYGRTSLEPVLTVSV